jgi:hypothetical protein
MQVAVGEQRVLRCQLWNVVDSSDKLGLAIPDGDRHRCETSSRFHRRDNGGPTVAPSGDRRVRRYGSEPSRGGTVCDCAVERHHEMTVGILKALGPPVALDIRTTGVYSPARGRERAADEGLVPGLAYSNRNVSLSFGQIEKLVAQQEFEPKAGVACMKGVDEGCFKRLTPPSEGDDLACMNRIVRSDNDLQTLDRIVHVIGEINILVDRLQQIALLTLA